MNQGLANLLAAKELIAAEFDGQGEFKILREERGDFGLLDGLQFDCERCGGFLYIWSRGRIEFHLVDYLAGAEVFPITVKQIEVIDEVSDIINSLILAIRNLKLHPMR